MSAINKTTASIPVISSLGSVSPFDRGRNALQSKDLSELKTLFESNGCRVDSFLNVDDIREYCRSASLENELDLGMLNWLLTAVPASLIGFECQSLFRKVVALGDKGLPILKILYSSLKGALSNFTLEQCLEASIQNGEKSRITIQWLLENEANAFQKILSFNPAAIRIDKSWQVLEFYLNNCKVDVFGETLLISLFTQLATLGKEGLPAMKLLWEKSPAVENIYQRYVEMLFEKMDPTCLGWIEEASVKRQSKLSPYTLRWCFLKAAAKKELGFQLMKFLCKKVPEKLSYWTLAQTCKELEKSGNIAAAKEFRAESNSLFKDLEKSPVDDDDIRLHLTLSKNPSGFHILGDIPERHSWKPLTQEELNNMVDHNSIEANEFPFDDTVEIVDDGISNLAPSQIRKSEAALFRQFFACIKYGFTSIKIEGDQEFAAKILLLIKKLLSRPSGRWLLLFISRQGGYLPIRPSEKCLYNFRSNPPFLGVEFTKQAQSFHYSRSEKGEFAYPCFLDAALFHELLHARHYQQNPILAHKLCGSIPLDEVYGNLEEQYTIAGVDDESILVDFFPLTENTYNCERGRFARYGHLGRTYENLSEKDREAVLKAKTLTANHSSQTKIKEASNGT